MVIIVIYAAGCNHGLKKDGADECVPECGTVASQCVDDGCGSICPCIDESEVCDDEGICVAEDECADGCDSRECGRVCGIDCGTCADNEVCEDGKCMCRPECDSVHCGVDDGCGGLCDCESGKACDIDRGICVDSLGACDGKECGTWDGEHCGDCTDDLLCDADGRCVADCDDLCSDVGWECDDSICHDVCGECPENEVCINHVCVCRPSCEPGSCNDGCGGTCECEVGKKCDTESGLCVPCTEDDTCGDMQCGSVCGVPCGEYDGECGDSESCIEGYCFASTLAMSVVSAEVSEEDGKVHGVIEITYQPRPGEPRPQMADLRLTTDWEVELEVESATLGGAATQAHKSLYADPISLLPWRYRPDGAVQFLIHTDEADLASAADRFQEGVLMSIDFVVDLTEDDPGTSAQEDRVSFSLRRRDQTFAPFDADIALQETAYDHTVMVTR